MKPKANFYAKLVEKPSNFLEFYKQSHDLVEMIEDVHQMKLYYTYVSNAYRMKLITQQERSELIAWGMDNTANHTTCENSIADYKIILDKAEADRLINRKTRYILDSKAEDKKTENQPYIRDLKSAVKRNTEHLKIIESNVGAINNSLNKLKEGMKHKLAIETTVGFIGAVLNALSFGVAGSAVQGAMELTLGQIVDFGDITHIIEVAESVNDIEIQEIIEFALEAAEDRAEDKLEEACKESYTLAVLTVAAASINPESQKVNQAENFEQPFLSDFNSDSKFDPEFLTLDEDDFPLHSAIKYGDLELLNEEIDLSLYDINMLDNQGRTPADFAAVKGQFEMLELIRSHGGTFALGSKAKMRNIAKKRKDLKYEFKTRNHLPNYTVGHTSTRH
ncbi:MAG: ankyrin repeat domain-containing protein [Oligoflexales bacterium]